jgi:hypothetical protein
MIHPRSRLISILVGATFAAALLIACNGGGDSADETSTPSDDATPRVTGTASDATPNGSATAPSSGTPSAGETPDGNGGNGGSTTVPAGAEDAVQAAKEDLANTYEGRTADEVKLVSIAAKDWPDACLGVPGRGEACAQVITPGYEMVLDLEGAHYFYHTDEGTNVRLADFDLDPSS